MGIKAVWGFDPDEVVRAQKAFQRMADQEEAAPDHELEQVVRMPVSVDAQIYQLRRMFRL